MDFCSHSDYVTHVFFDSASGDVHENMKVLVRTRLFVMWKTVISPFFLTFKDVFPLPVVPDTFGMKSLFFMSIIKECTSCFDRAPDFNKHRLEDLFCCTGGSQLSFYHDCTWIVFYSNTKMLHLHVILNAPMNLQLCDAALRRTHALRVFIHNDK